MEVFSFPVHHANMEYILLHPALFLSGMRALQNYTVVQSDFLVSFFPMDAPTSAFVLHIAIQCQPLRKTVQ